MEIKGEQNFNLTLRGHRDADDFFPQVKSVHLHPKYRELALTEALADYDFALLELEQGGLGNCEMDEVRPICLMEDALEEEEEDITGLMWKWNFRIEEDRIVSVGRCITHFSE